MKVKNMYKVFCYLIMFTLVNLSFVNLSLAQNVIYSQDFEDPAQMDWILNSPIDYLGTVESTVNFFQVNDIYAGGNVNGNIVPNTDPQVAPINGFPNSNYLHVTSFQAQANNIQNTNYLDVFYSFPPFIIINQELLGVQTPDISTVGFTGVELDFHWLAGESTNDNGAQLFYSINQGNTWVEIGDVRSDSTWYNEVTNLNNILDDLPNVRFAFVFNNDLGGSDFTSFAIDDFRVIADCEIDLGEDYFVCSGETTTIQADTILFNSYIWNTGENTDNIDVVVNSDTTIILSASSDGCLNITDTLDIFVQFDRPVLSLQVQSEENGIGIDCFGDSTGVLNLEVIGGIANPDSSYNVSWFDSNMNLISSTNIEEGYFNNFTSILNNVYQGEFFVEVTDAVCTVPQLDSIEIFSNDDIENSFDIQNVSCFQGSDAQLTANPSSGVAPYQYDWGFYGQNQMISGLSSGTYTVVITDSLGCSKPFTTNISQPNQLLVDASIQTEISCLDSTNGVLTAVAYGGTPDVNGDYYFIWSHPNFDWVDNIENHNDTIGNLPPSVSAIDAQNPNYQSFTYPYLVTVTDANGCEATSEIYLVEPQELEVFVTQDVYPAYCNNNTLGLNTGFAQVSAQGGTPNSNNNYDFVWSLDGQTDQDVLFSSINNVNAGTYNVTVVDQRLCADQISIEIGLETTWEFYGSTTPATCYGSNDGSVSIQMEGGCGDSDNSCGFTYLWQGGSSTGNNLPNVSGLQQGNYSVVVTDEWGCQATYPFVVEGPTPIEFQVTSLTDQTCYSTLGSSSDGAVEVNINGGNGPYDVFWVDQNALQYGPIQTNDIAEISGLIDGSWEIRIFDVNGCQGVYDIASLHSNPFIIDPGKQVEVEINTDDLFLTDTIKCYGDETASAIVLNSDPLFNYSWYSSDDPTTVIEEGISSNSLPAGDIYVVASYELGLCTENSAPVTIEQMSPFNIVENHVSPSCFGDEDAVINVVVDGATPFLDNIQQSDYNFEWFPSSLNGLGVVQTNGQLEFSIPNMFSGSYFLKVVDRFGCDTVFDVTVLPTQPLSANIDLFDLSCNVSNAAADGQLNVNVVGGTAPFSNFELTQGIALIQSNDNGNFQGLNSGTYTLTFQDVRGCEFTEDNIILSQPPSLDLTVQSFTDVLCNGENTGDIQLTATGGTQPFLSFNITNPINQSSNDGLFQSLSANTYTLEVEDQNGCIDQFTQVIGEPTLLQTPTFSVTDATCFGFSDGIIESFVSGGTQPYVYSWNNGENEQDIEMLTSGNYTLVVTDDNGCTQTSTAIVGQPQEIFADWVINTPGSLNDYSIISQPIPFTVSFIDSSQNHDPLLTEWWIDGINRTNDFYGFGNDVEHTFREIGEYEVVMYALNSNGCFDTISVDVTVQGINHINAFSPNADNINDFFYFENYGISELNAVLYNRWGDKIYEMNSPDDVWDGISINGLEVSEGVYLYVLNAKGEDGTDYNQKGTVSLFK